MFFVPSILLLSAAMVQAHMRLDYPPSLNAPNNPHTQGEGDQYLTFPYNCCGRKDPEPCRGYLDLLGTPAGTSVASWQAGSTQSFNLTGTGTHYGGSCQVGFSTDGGKTFRVATSYEGNCPHRAGAQDFDFTVPADLPSGEAVFAWTWINREQEFYMNCAVVSIEGGSSSGGVGDSVPSPPPTSTSSPTPPQESAVDLEGCSCSCPSPVPEASDASTYSATNCACTCPRPASARALVRHKRAHQHARHDNNKTPSSSSPSGPSSPKSTGTANVAFSARPKMLIAALGGGIAVGGPGNGCDTPATSAEVKYPEPGPEVVEGDGEYPLELPSGECAGRGFAVG